MTIDLGCGVGPCAPAGFKEAFTVAGVLTEFGPTAVVPVGGADWEPLWDRLVSRHHYLGYRKPLGHRLKYLVALSDRPAAALSWSAPALKLAERNCFIGWSPGQRKRHLIL